MTAPASTSSSPCSPGTSRSCPPDEFADDPRNYGSAERFLQLAIETVLSIVNHVIRPRLGIFDRFAQQITSYADRS